MAPFWKQQKYLVFPVVMYGCESWTIKKAEHRRIDAFELWCWRRLLRVPWTARRSNQSIIKEVSPGCSLEGLMLKLKLQYFGYLMQRADSFEKTLILGKIEGRRRRGRQRMRWLDGITNSMNMSLSSWWWTGRPGMLRWSQSRTRLSDWTDLNWNYLTIVDLEVSLHMKQYSNSVPRFEASDRLWTELTGDKCTSNIPSPNFVDLMMVSQVWQVSSSVLCLSCPIHWCQSLVPVLLHDSFYILLHVQGEDILLIFSLVPGEVGLNAFWNLSSPHLVSVGSGLLWLCETSLSLWFMNCPQTSCGLSHIMPSTPMSWISHMLPASLLFAPLFFSF